MISTFSVTTSQKRQLIDITDKIENLVKKSKVAEGVVSIFARHTTCGLIISEVEDNLEKDIISFIEKEGPKGPFTHSHAGQSHTPAHLLSALIGQQVSVPISKNEMLLGIWQKVCLLELDGPRKRELVVQIL